MSAITDDRPVAGHHASSCTPARPSASQVTKRAQPTGANTASGTAATGTRSPGRARPATSMSSSPNALAMAVVATNAIKPDASSGPNTAPDTASTAAAVDSRLRPHRRGLGDVQVDVHHTVEDVAIVLGQALRQALGEKKGIRRFGDAMIPMDETLAQAIVDVSGRPYTVTTGEPDVMRSFVVGGHYPTVLNRHVFKSLAFHAHINMHVRVLRGRDPHHITEAQFKAVARALRAATEYDDRITGIASTNGAL